MLDSAGNVVSSQKYYPFGQSRNFTLVGTDKQFTGHQREGEFYYMRARFYDPQVGRFLQPDSVVPDYADPQALNRYSYTVNNPLRYVDPTGRCHGVLASAEEDPLCFDRLPEQFPPDSTQSISSELAPEPVPTLLATPCPAPQGGSVSCPPEEGESNLLGALLNALTSECGQGVAKLVGSTIVIGGSVFLGAYYIQAGYLVTTSLAAAGTSATGIAVLSAPPTGAQTILRVGRFYVTGYQQIQSC